MGVIGSNSKWNNISFLDNGICRIQTLSPLTDQPTIIAVYTIESPIATTIADLHPVPGACGITNSIDGTNSFVIFEVNPENEYAIVIDTSNNQQGTIGLELELTKHVTESTNPSNYIFSVNGILALEHNPFGIAKDTYFQWHLNGASITNATNFFLINSLSSTNRAGIYSLVISNFAGNVTSIIANVEIDPPIHMCVSTFDSNSLDYILMEGQSRSGIAI